MDEAYEPAAAAAIAPLRLIPHDVAQRRFADSVRLFVGFGRRYPVEALAHATAIPVSTMRSYHEGRATPGLCNLWALAGVLPPAFINMNLELAGMGGAYMLAPYDGTAHTAVAQLTARLHKLTQALSDGQIDHAEARALAPEMRALAAEMNSFAAALDGAA